MLYLPDSYARKKVKVAQSAINSIKNDYVTKNALGYLKVKFSDVWQNKSGVDINTAWKIEPTTGIISIASNVYSGWVAAWVYDPENIGNYYCTTKSCPIVIGLCSQTYRYLAFSVILGSIWILADNGSWVGLTKEEAYPYWSKPWLPFVDFKFKISISGQIVTFINVDDDTVINSIDISLIPVFQDYLEYVTLGAIGFAMLGSNSGYPSGKEVGILETSISELYITSGYIYSPVSPVSPEEGGEPLGVHWNGKTWHAFGTSMTSESTGKWVDYVANKSGLTVTNHGIGGGSIAGNIYTAIQSCPQNTDLVTLECVPNDTDETLGQFGDTTNTTFYGALDMCLKWLTENTDARIVTITTHSSRYNYLDPSETYGTYFKTATGHYWEEYVRAVQEVSHAYGVSFIDGGESGLAQVE